MPPDKRDRLISATVLRLAEIAEESQRPGYHGHGLVPRFFDEVRQFVQKLDSEGECEATGESK